MNIYVDDLRILPKDFDLIFKSAEEFLEWLDNKDNLHIELLSLDHDLGKDLMTGYDLVKVLVERLKNKKLTLSKIKFHTSNPTGHKNMVFYMENANKHLDLNIYVDNQFYGF